MVPVSFYTLRTDFIETSTDCSFEAASKNAEIFTAAVLAANDTRSNNIKRADRSVIISEGSTVCMSSVAFTGVQDITITIDGTIVFNDDIERWDTENSRTAQLYFIGSQGIRIDGTGTVDGQGLKWWRSQYFVPGLSVKRPVILQFLISRDIEISGVTFLNSPQNHIYFKDCADIIVHDVTIFVDSALQRLRDDHRHDSVTYPLNTDGIDIKATNVTIFNCNITSYDDAIVPKPCTQAGVFCTCSGDIFAYNNTIYYSTGLAIGSVPPNANTNCVRNVTFKDTYLYRPFKAIYVKSNPSDTGKGIIEDVTFENILIEEALWWAIWIGPQQQNQPGQSSSGTGCNFLYPFIPRCPTQPLVSMDRITLRNVTAFNTVPLFEGPGVLLCDPETPCTNIEFIDVTVEMFSGNASDVYAELPFDVPGVLFPLPTRSDDWEFEYLVENVFGLIEGSNPMPIFEK